MNRTPEHPPKSRRKAASSDSCDPGSGPSVRRLDDDPHKVFMSFIGHLARVARPPETAAPPRKSPRRKAGAP
jgi:hypothetical protein